MACSKCIVAHYRGAETTYPVGQGLYLCVAGTQQVRKCGVLLLTWSIFGAHDHQHKSDSGQLGCIC